MVYMTDIWICETQASRNLSNPCTTPVAMVLNPNRKLRR